MNAKLLILLLLGVSFVFFGCAKKDAETVPNETGDVAVPDEGQVSDDTVAGDTGGTVVNDSQEDETEKLADLFQIDSDKPLGDEGLDMDSPSSKD